MFYFEIFDWNEMFWHSWNGSISIWNQKWIEMSQSDLKQHLSVVPCGSCSLDTSCPLLPSMPGSLARLQLLWYTTCLSQILQKLDFPLKNNWDGKFPTSFSNCIVEMKTSDLGYFNDKGFSHLAGAGCGSLQIKQCIFQRKLVLQDLQFCLFHTSPPGEV